MTMSQALTCLFSAVLVLSADHGEINARLDEAYRCCLSRVVPTADLPEHLQSGYMTLVSEIKQFVDDDGRKADQRNAARLAKQVVKFYDLLRDEVGA